MPHLVVNEFPFVLLYLTLQRLSLGSANKNANFIYAVMSKVRMWKCPHKHTLLLSQDQAFGLAGKLAMARVHFYFFKEGENIIQNMDYDSISYSYIK